MPLVATNEPFFATREDYEAHDALLLHRRGPAHRRRRAPPAHGGASLQDPRRNGGAVRRSAGGAGGDGRDRPTLRVPPAHAGADPAAILRGLGDSKATARPTRPRNCAAPRGRAGAPPGAPSDRARPHRRGLSRPARLRARRHRGHEIRRLLPHRRRFHPMGEGAGHSGRAGPRLRRRFAGRLRARPSPISIRSASGCCSSASSIPSACRCRTSTSISARTGATK